MANPTKDTTSIRVHAPPGGHSNNIFGTSEFEQSAANKKKHMHSDIFGSNTDNVEAAPAVKKNQSAGNNIFGSDLEQAHSKTESLAGQYKQTQMKSSIFGSDEPTSTRTVTNKNRSDIFGTANNDDQKKGQAGPRQGHRVGYNPINGESYSTKEPVNDKQPEKTEKAPEEQPVVENGSTQAAPSPSNGSAQAAPPADASEKATAQKSDNANDGNNAQKNVHTSVRVFHPPGGKSNGPLW